MQDSDHHPAPASTGRQAIIFDLFLQNWRSFFDFGVASIASLTPSGLFPGGEVVGGVLGEVDASAVTEDLITFS
jgi:hypothetical protein